MNSVQTRVLELGMRGRVKKYLGGTTIPLWVIFFKCKSLVGTTPWWNPLDGFLLLSDQNAHASHGPQGFTGASLLISWPCPFQPLSPVPGHSSSLPTHQALSLPTVHLLPLCPELSSPSSLHANFLPRSLYLTSSRAPSMETLSNVTFLNYSTFNLLISPMPLITVPTYLDCLSHLYFTCSLDYDPLPKCVMGALEFLDLIYPWQYQHDAARYMDTPFPKTIQINIHGYMIKTWLYIIFRRWVKGRNLVIEPEFAPKATWLQIPLLATIKVLLLCFRGDI